MNFINVIYLQVFCIDCSKLTLDVMAYRGLNPHLCDVHIGLDGGQDILKVALTITERQGGHTSGRAYYYQVFEILLISDFKKISAEVSNIFSYIY